MKSSKLAGMILAGLTITLAGCGAPRSEGEPAAKAEHSAQKEGGHSGPSDFSSPVPPIEPSMVPAMPSSAKADMDKVRAEMARPEQPKEAEKKAEEPAKAGAPK